MQSFFSSAVATAVLCAVCLVAALRDLEVAASTVAKPTTSLYTTTNNNNNNNVLRERPNMDNTLEQQMQQQRHLSGDSYYFNTYNPSNQQLLIHDQTMDSRSKEIPWGAINIVVVTDVHSWIAGNHQDDPRHWPYDAHRQINQDADYGDVLSFYRNLQTLVQEHNNNNNNNKRDLFFVMNGDFVDGTGFSGYPPTHLAPLLKHMPWDAVNVGNHELYHDETIQYIIDQQAEQANDNLGATNRWNQKGYLSSNTVLTTTNTTTTTAAKSTSTSTNTDLPPVPMTGHRYTYLEGKNTNTTILVFGFLYDFDEGGSLTSHVDVKETIQEDWFLDVLAADNFDAVLVMAHMDCLHPLIETIRTGIRSALPLQKSMPIQFVTGHTHRRCHAKLDPLAESFEAGRFLDTIGFVSLDNLDSSDTTTFTTVFEHRFWDANRDFMHQTLRLAHHQQASTTGSNDGTSESSKRVYKYDFDEDFGTPEGKALSLAIQSTQSELGLDEVVGCSPQTYGIFEDPPEATHTPTNDPSLWHLYLQKMLPHQLLAPIHHNTIHSGEPVFVSGTGVLRYSLFEGPVTVNDIIAISPFNDTIHQLFAESQTKDLPIYGWQLLDWLASANELYARAGEYGLATFVLSVLNPQQQQQQVQDIASAHKSIDPSKVYRIFATDYDAFRLLSVAMKASGSAFAQGRLYKSQLAYPCESANDAYLLTELWKEYIRDQMPCVSQDKPHLRSDVVSLVQVQLLPSATSATVHSRMTPAQEDEALASDQKAAALLVVVAVAMIVYLMLYPPEQQQSEKKQSAGPDSTFTEDQNREKHDGVNVQLIPLRRYNTGNLSEGSYGSI